jgi:hypothetical protein
MTRLLAPLLRGGLVGLILWLTGLFVIISLQALAFRFGVTWGIDILSWWRGVLNHVASIYPGTH